MRQQTIMPTQAKKTNRSTSSLLQHATINRIPDDAVLPKEHKIASSSVGFTELDFNHDFSRVPVRTATTMMIQPKLTIGQPNDKFEQEADRVAEQVMRMPEPCDRCQGQSEEDETLRTKPLSAQITPLVQRQVEPEEEEETEAIQAKLTGDRQVQRQVEEPEEEDKAGSIQTKRNDEQIPQVKPGFETQIRALRGGGQLLPQPVRAFFEPRFGYDFSQIRVHTDRQAAETAQAVKARAYTIGRDMVFGPGQYAPDTNEGQRLLAHELTHVVQQNHKSLRNQQIIQQCLEEQPSSEQGWEPFTIPGTDRNAAYSTDRGADGHVREFTERASEGEEGYQGREFACFRESQNSWQVVSRMRSGTSGTTTTSPAVTSRTGTRTFALTFDDGPHQAPLSTGQNRTGQNRTENVLDTLEARGLRGRAAFFIQTGLAHRGAHPVGRALVERMLDEGYTVGIHTGGEMTHEELHPQAHRAGRLVPGLTQGRQYISERVREVNEARRARGQPPISEISPEQQMFVRAVGGSPGRGQVGRQVREVYAGLHLTHLHWDINGDPDGRNMTLPQLSSRFDSGLASLNQDASGNYIPRQSGSSRIVVLYHDIRPGTSRHIGGVIDHIRRVVPGATFDRP